VDAVLIERLTTWARSMLAPFDVPADAPVHLIKQRPWSTVLVVRGPVSYFVKANSPGQAAEPVLLRQLARWVSDAIVELGVPDFHPQTVCDRLRLIGEELEFSKLQLARIHMLADQLEPVAVALAASPLADGLSHGDLHANNLFGPPTSKPFDWGDAVVGHPFCTLSNLRMSLDDDDFYFILRDRYLQEWGDLMDPVELRRDAEHAEIAGCVAAIWTWLRVGPEGIALHPNSIPSWIDRLEALLR
jgi:aminoglycoside phosphotransferase (APT) family kinase protein